jgi:hypothetical protein
MQRILGLESDEVASSSAIFYFVNYSGARMMEARMERWTSLKREMCAGGSHKFSKNLEATLKF